MIVEEYECICYITLLVLHRTMVLIYCLVHGLLHSTVKGSLVDKLNFLETGHDICPGIAAFNKSLKKKVVIITTDLLLELVFIDFAGKNVDR